jgi:hypothetical protein
MFNKQEQNECVFETTTIRDRDVSVRQENFFFEFKIRKVTISETRNSKLKNTEIFERLNKTTKFAIFCSMLVKNFSFFSRQEGKNLGKP